MSDDRSVFFEKGYLFKVLVFTIERKEEKEKKGREEEREGGKLLMKQGRELAFI